MSPDLLFSCLIFRADDEKTWVRQSPIASRPSAHLEVNPLHRRAVLALGR